MKITGKAKMQSFRADLVGALLAGSSTATGSVLGVQNEAATVPASPYQVTVANSATFSADLGVLDGCGSDPEQAPGIHG